MNVVVRGAGIACLGIISAACGASDREWVDAPPPTTGTQKFVGCVGATSQPDRFVFSVSKGRNATYGDPPGTIVPQPAPLPPGSPPPVTPPAGSVGLPGDGADAITRIATYNLVGDGGLDLAAHVGHTVQIVGDLEEIPEAERASPGSDTLMRQLRVTSATHVSDECLGDP